jgi:hypothetical protein
LLSPDAYGKVSPVRPMFKKLAETISKTIVARGQTFSARQTVPANKALMARAMAKQLHSLKQANSDDRVRDPQNRLNKN